MNNRGDELIHKYLLAIASDEEVYELEQLLTNDLPLQDQFALQAELDAHLRQEAQSAGYGDRTLRPHATRSVDRGGNGSSLWKWLSGISTSAAVILMMLFVFNDTPSREAMPVLSLSKVHPHVSTPGRSLWVAAAIGDRRLLQTELQLGADVDARNEESYTPLHIAAVYGRPAVVDVLLIKNAEVDLRDKEGNTALHMAVFFGQTEIVRALLAHGADPLAKNAAGFTPIDCAGAPWNADYEAHLRRAEAQTDVPLNLIRIRGERLAILSLLVEGTHGSLQQHRSSSPACALKAAIVGDVAAIHEYLADGGDINESEHVGGNTPLMLAATFGNHDIAAVLIDAGADLECQNNTGSTALHQACFFGRPKIVELLLAAGADPSAVNAYSATPLDLAADHFTLERKAAYEHTYKNLNLELDFEKLRDAHEAIRRALMTHAGTK